ncbi:hypothetical protein [Sedimentitalea sp.]|uniref:hypothetical protein n=1 Tax=Sedimentitalea sp. TaxID=2048915 RepID=UPI0032986CA5
MSELSLSPNVFRVSRRGNASLDNAFFAALENEISDALVGDDRPLIDQSGSHYVCNRVTSADQSVISALTANLPKDVVDVLRDFVVGDDLRPAFFEIDLINFLINSRSNRVLSIIGPVGIGKSTFMQFVFGEVRDKCPSLQKFMPIIINGLHIGDDDPVYSELFQRLHTDCYEALNNNLDEKPPSGILAQIEAYYEREQYSERGIQPSSTTIVEYFALLRDILPEYVEPVVIFDNLDQMASSAVAKISHLSRGIYLKTRTTMILCMRPPTFATHIEVDANKGAFYTFQIALPSPNIREVINNRLRRVMRGRGRSFTIHDPNSGFRLQIPNTMRALENLNRNVLTEWNQDLLIRGIACNNVRKALAAFYRFLRFSELDYRSLFDVVVTDSREQAVERRQHDWNEHFLKGLLTGGKRYFESRVNSPIFNLYFFDSVEHTIDYCVIYRVLSAFYFSRGLTERRQVQTWLASVGYDRALVDHAIGTMLKARLLTSPEHETDVRFVSHLSITESGKYYCEQLVNDRTYLYELIFDIPLSHIGWEPETTREFESRVRSIVEYLGRVLRQEKAEIDRIEQSRNVAQISGIVLHAGLLSRHVVEAAKETARIGFYAKSEHVEAVARSLDAELDKIVGQVFALEQKLRDVLIDKSYISGGTVEEQEKSWQLGQFGEFSVRFPETLEPAGENFFQAKLDLQFDEEPDVLMAWIKPEGGVDEVERVWPLEKAPDRDFYLGEVVFEDVTFKRPFPEASLTVFADSRPLFTRKI